MDYRERKYYFVLIEYGSYDMRLRYFHIVAPSLKVHYMNDYRRRFAKQCDFMYPNLLLSCRKEDAEDLEYEMRKAERRDSYSTWQEVTRSDELKCRPPKIDIDKLLRE